MSAFHAAEHQVEIGDRLASGVDHLAADLRHDLHEAVRFESPERRHDGLAAEARGSSQFLDEYAVAEAVFRLDQVLDDPVIDRVLLVHRHLPSPPGRRGRVRAATQRS